MGKAFILWLLSYIYVSFGNVAWVAAIFYGLKPAVLAIVGAAVIRIGSRALKNAIMWTLAGLAFIAIYFFHFPFPLVMLIAALMVLLNVVNSSGEYLLARFVEQAAIAASSDTAAQQVIIIRVR